MVVNNKRTDGRILKGIFDNIHTYTHNATALCLCI